MSELRHVGKPAARPEGADKLSGKARYIHDVTRPGMLYGKIKFSEHAHARIRNIDTSKAKALPGVHAVITAYDTPEVRIGFLRDNFALKRDKVRQFRDEIAAVAAVDPDVARHVGQSLQAKLAAAGAPGRRAGGEQVLADILRHAGAAAEDVVLRGLGERQPELVHAVRRRTFVFEDIVDLPAGLLCEAVGLLTGEDLAIALRTAGQQVRSKVLKALPSATARHIRRQMERIGPVRLSDVEAAQQRVVEAVRNVREGQYAASGTPSEAANHG